jgi:vitamin B12/bleomycin/antimicrobial peptide transport system ATP-binding/permease protein
MQVQLALNWLADNAMNLADWFASSHRVTQLSDAMEHLEETLGPVGQGETIKFGVSPDNCKHLRRVKIALHDRQLMIKGSETIIAPGEKLLVRGETGTGKSTLIHAMAGLWPWGSGEILLPNGAYIAFLPLRPYFPVGTLRSALLYPHLTQEVPDETIRHTFILCGFEHFIPRLEETDHWSALLSTSEQQRLAFARVLIRPPDILFMDEPTSSLDELSQFKLMEYMRDLQPDTMVIHARYRLGLERVHDREITFLRKTPDGTAVMRKDDVTPTENAARALKRPVRNDPD